MPHSTLTGGSGSRLVAALGLAGAFGVILCAFPTLLEVPIAEIVAQKSAASLNPLSNADPAANRFPEQLVTITEAQVSRSGRLGEPAPRGSGLDRLQRQRRMRRASAPSLDR
jgi:hypothetical protein